MLPDASATRSQAHCRVTIDPASRCADRALRPRPSTSQAPDALIRRTVKSCWAAANRDNDLPLCSHQTDSSSNFIKMETSSRTRNAVPSKSASQPPASSANRVRRQAVSSTTQLGKDALHRGGFSSLTVQ